MNPIVDPHTGTNGLAYYVGYFELQLDGSMTFTREAASTTVAPPPAPMLSIARSGNVSSISFLSTNQATYTLLFTNTAGLTAPPKRLAFLASHPHREWLKADLPGHHHRSQPHLPRPGPIRLLGFNASGCFVAPGSSRLFRPRAHFTYFGSPSES